MVAVLSFTSLDSLAYRFGFNVSSTPSFRTPSHTHFCFFPDLDSLSNSLTIELKIRGVGFVLKKLFTHFEMLIVSHGLIM